MNKSIKTILVTAAIALLFSGCTTLSPDSESNDTTAPQAQADTAPTYQPYHPDDFEEILIPGELTWNREESMTINTDSFAGGILNFTGRVEINSLTDFFISTMKKNGWTMNGSVKSEDVLLAFTREGGNCMIKIRSGSITKGTNVFVYINRTTK